MRGGRAMGAGCGGWAHLHTARAQCHAIERACLHDSEVVVYDRGPEDAKPVLDPGCDEGGEQGDLAPRDR